MVWGLFPIESLSGEQKYFIFTKGTYKVGRKGCDVIINTDKGVSRIHAEVIVDSMISMDPLQKKSTSSSVGVRIKDCSKYGTFINKTLGSKIKIQECPDKEASIKDGDLISFGTGNATYRFCFVPLIFFVCCLKPYHMSRPLQKEISSIGARATHSWSVECTHVLVDESGPVKEDLLDAVVAQKPVVLRNWVKAVSEKSICTDIPSYAAYIPTLVLEGYAVKIVEPKVRENCLVGYTFLLGVAGLYKFDDRLQPLLNLGGAKVLSAEEFCSSTQAPEDGAGNHVVLVIPTVPVNQFNQFQKLRSLLSINETSLVSAVLSGHLDPSIVESASMIVASSCSTDETVVADSDVEEEVVASDQIAPSASLEETRKQKFKEELSEHHLNITEEKTEISKSEVEDGGIIERRVKSDDSDTTGTQNSDILYSQDLIVRDAILPTAFNSSTVKGVLNFKCFKKRETQSGNSFRNLIPYSKYPFKESDYGNEEVAEHVKEEKKRKQMEAIAEDLFNHEKPRRRAAGTSVHGLLTRG